MAKSQIIKDIVLDNISLESALYRLLVITYSLRNEGLLLWVESELNGYSEERLIPSYRKNVSYKILYTGFNANTKVTNQPLSESYFDKEVREILKNRVIRSGINIVEEILKNDRESSYNLIELAGMVSKNSEEYIKCARLEQVLSRTNYSKLISNVISTAGGGKSDIIGDYGKFNIGIEVTLSTGQKQFEMEGEPVSRHIGEMQVEKPTFGIFIADSLNETVINHFYTLSHQKSKIYNGTVDIIPMDTRTFIEFFKQATCKNIEPEELYSIHEHSILVSKQMFIEDKTEEDWHNSVIQKVFEIVG